MLSGLKGPDRDFQSSTDRPSSTVHIRERARALGKLPEDSRLWERQVDAAYEYYDRDKLDVESEK